jgi:hypothetical protein
MDNLRAWLSLTSEATADGLSVTQHGVLFIDCSDVEMRRRLGSRGRADDTAEIIGTRITEGHREFAPVIEHFRETRKVLNASLAARVALYYACCPLFIIDALFRCLLCTAVSSRWRSECARGVRRSAECAGPSA